MKNYKITVNGTTYDVAVEEVGAGAAPSAAAPVVAPVAAPAPAPQGATADDILKAISGLSAQVTTGLIQTTPQPTPATAESILAEIINPPQKTTN